MLFSEKEDRDSLECGTCNKLWLHDKVKFPPRHRGLEESGGITQISEQMKQLAPGSTAHHVPAIHVYPHVRLTDIAWRLG